MVATPAELGSATFVPAPAPTGSVKRALVERDQRAAALVNAEDASLRRPLPSAGDTQDRLAGSTAQAIQSYRFTVSHETLQGRAAAAGADDASGGLEDEEETCRD